MTTRIKVVASAVMMALASMAAQAIPLNSVSGPAQWKLNGLTTESNTAAGTDETTWGLGSITGISSLGGNWAAGEGGTYLYYMLYGIADQNIIGTRKAGGVGGPTDFDIYNIGATGGVADGKIHLDIYQSSTQIPSIDQFFNANPNTRTGFNSNSLLASLGGPYLKLEFAPGKSDAIAPATNATCAALNPFDTCETQPGTNESLATLVQHTFGTVLPTSGTGTFFANVVGGSAAAKWDTNGQPLGTDFDANFTLKPNGAAQGTGTCTASQIASGDCFAGFINDPATALAVPEPGSLALAALAMLGAGVALRRTKV
jgi:hypothetical protein